MTREEAIKMLADTKVYVDGKSREIQEKLFSLGFYWRSGSKQVLFEEKPFLFLWKNMNIRYSSDLECFTKNLCREITAADILSIVIDEPEYRPFKNADECWEEMKKHRLFGWLKSKSGDYKVINSVNFARINSNDYYYTYKQAFDIFTFIDGTPFGVKEEEKATMD